jgi:hypothetical protein
MRFRTVALALALTFGVGAVAEAKKTPVHKTKKVKRQKAHKASKRPASKHVKHA